MQRCSFCGTPIDHAAAEAAAAETSRISQACTDAIDPHQTGWPILSPHYA